MVRDAQLMTLWQKQRAFASPDQATLYRGAGLPVWEAANSVERASSYLSHRVASATDGQVTFSPLSKPASAAWTRFSVVITVAWLRAERGMPELSQISVAVVAGWTNWTFTPVFASSS